MLVSRLMRVMFLKHGTPHSTQPRIGVMFARKSTTKEDLSECIYKIVTAIEGRRENSHGGGRISQRSVRCALGV